MTFHPSLRLVTIAAFSLLTAGCAATTSGSAESADADVYSADPVVAEPDYRTIPNPAFAEIVAAEDSREKDRRAILAMRGEYRVDFNFAETVPLAAGYERRDDKVTSGYETVVVVSDEPGRIVLQHILVSEGGHVVKHWRQDWLYQASHRFEFIADQAWALRALPADRTEGAWTQCVYEVSDAPRYCGTGTWNHRYGVSTWTSDRSWRPLPRREYTIRDDYNALNAENRHTVTPHGWTHEQDNTKTLRDGAEIERTLVREFGFNDYQRIEGFDFSPAYVYWNRTADYWARVRAAWDDRLWTGGTLVLTTEIDGMPIIEGTFELANEVETMTPAQQKAAIEEILAEWTRRPEDVVAR